MDWIASLMTLGSMFLVAHGYMRAGMALGAAAQFPWLAVAVEARLWGMVAFEVAGLGIYLYGFARRGGAASATATAERGR